MAEEKKGKEQEVDELFDEDEQRIETSTKEKKEEEQVAKKEKKSSVQVAQVKRAPGTEDVDTEDWRPTRFRLLHPLSADVVDGKGVAGKIKIDLTNEQLDKIQLIPIQMRKSRILFDEEDRQGPPLCRSVGSFKENRGSNIAINNGTCIGCPKKEGFPSECTVSYNYLMIRPEGLKGYFVLPGILTLSKSSTNTAQKINQSVLGGTPFWNYIWEFSSKIRKFTRGPAHVLEAIQVRETNDIERKTAELIYNAVSPEHLEVDIDGTDIVEE